jgi:hypothetical protein
MAEDIEIQQLARQHGATAIDALVKIAIKGKSESARVSAAIALLDRGFGKATQPVESDVNLVNYGISAVPLRDGFLTKWVELQPRIRHEREMLASCRSAPR